MVKIILEVDVSQLNVRFSGSNVLPGYKHAKSSMVENISRIQTAQSSACLWITTAIRYCGGPLVVACGGGQLRIFTEKGRSFDRPHATFARALGSFLLGGLLDSRGLAVLVEILSVISSVLLAALSRGSGSSRQR